jgi:serine/threonine-protein kinase
MSISLDEFVRSLTETGILPPDEITSLVNSLPVDRTRVNVEKLARDLVRKQKITRFQASVIFRGQSRGLRIGEYVVLDKIGSGGMGQVFKAKDRRTGKLLALKLLRATYTKSERAVTRFYREANTAARLKHRNLAAVSDAGEWNGLHYLVMELIDGRDTRAIVKKKGRLSVDASLDIIVQAARGLAYAHENGIIHRDMKPANLLLDKSGRVVILDLGLARLDESAQEAAGDEQGRLTIPGHFLGTLDFVAPEQAADAHEIDGRSDIYSLGCTLHYLLTGSPPYRRESAPLILMAHCMDPIPQLTTTSGVTDRLNAVFQQMLAKKNYDRFNTMCEVVAELEACQRELAGQPVPPFVPRRPREPWVPIEPTQMGDEPVPNVAANLAATVELPDSAPFPEIFPQPTEEGRQQSAETQVGTRMRSSDTAIEIGTSTATGPFESIGDMLRDQSPSQSWSAHPHGTKPWSPIAALAAGARSARDWLTSFWRR